MISLGRTYGVFQWRRASFVYRAHCRSNEVVSGVDEHTDLHPYHLGQGTDELGSRVAVSTKAFLVNDLAYREPQRGLEALFLAI
jgi:hypothetical protein